MPERRCAGCGRVAPKPDLVRLALQPLAHPAPPEHPGPVGSPLARAGRSGGRCPGPAERVTRRIVIDARGVLPGRGGYLCVSDRPAVPNAACLERALRRGGLNRALRADVSLDPDFVESSC